MQSGESKQARKIVKQPVTIEEIRVVLNIKNRSASKGKKRMVSPHADSSNSHPTLGGC
jgi:hypothetical protein